jgi:hypothetical protein
MEGISKRQLAVAGMFYPDQAHSILLQFLIQIKVVDYVSALFYHDI